MWANYRAYSQKLLYILDGKATQIFFLILIFLMISCLELLGIGLVGPYIAIVSDPELMNKHEKLLNFFSRLHIIGPHNQILALGISLIVIFFIKGAISYFAQRYVFAFSFHFRTALIDRLMNNYIHMPYEFFLRRNSSSITQAVLANTKAVVDDLMIPGIRLCSDVLVTLIIGAFLYFVSPQAMIILMTLVMTVIIIYLKLVRPRVREQGRLAAVANEQIINGVNESIAGIKEIRVLGVENYFVNRIHSASFQCANAQSGFMSMLILPKYLIEISLILFVITFSMYAIWGGGNIDNLMPVLAMFGVAGLRIMPALSQVSSSLVSMHYSSYALAQLHEDLVEAQKIPKVNYRTKANQHLEMNFEKISLSNISFSYKGKRHPTLCNLTLNIRRGQSIGLIGGSGAGKSTLIDILLGFHEIQGGEYLVDDINIGQATWPAWRDQFSYIPQNVFLIDDSFEKNIAFGQNDHELNRTKVLQAIEFAQLSSLLKKLPQGLQTIVGERGLRLSGGERQRIALARAFYSNRNILILDEATSALDNETERQVVEVVESFKGALTMVVIAHRLSTVKNCDVIYRLINGRLEPVTDRSQLI